MNTTTDQNIIQRLETAACMLNDYEQHNDCPEEVFGDRTAAETCDDAAAIIKQMIEALKIAKCYMDGGSDDETEQEDYSFVLQTIAEASGK